MTKRRTVIAAQELNEAVEFLARKKAQAEQIRKRTPRKVRERAARLANRLERATRGDSES